MSKHTPQSKYEFIKTKDNLYQIIANTDLIVQDQHIKKGTQGGFVEFPECFSPITNSWIYIDSTVRGDSYLVNSSVGSPHRVQSLYSTVHRDLQMANSTLLTKESTRNCHFSDTQIICDFFTGSNLKLEMCRVTGYGSIQLQECHFRATNISTQQGQYICIGGDETYGQVFITNGAIYNNMSYSTFSILGYRVIIYKTYDYKIKMVINTFNNQRVFDTYHSILDILKSGLPTPIIKVCIQIIKQMDCAHGV